MAVKMRLTRLGDKKSPFYRIVISDKTLAEGAAELTNRYTGESQMVKLVDLAKF
jgi:ribosomal protein S16